MSFIKPVWFKENEVIDVPLDQRWWCTSMLAAEAHYARLIQQGWKPEQAREVLPNALKTEIVCTATLGEWKHMLEQRTSPAAHPQIRALMTPVLDQFKQELPEIFMADK